MKKNHKIIIGVIIGGLVLNYFFKSDAKGIRGFFDNSTIKSLDDLKKQYFKLAKVYHPDAGGTTAQFQELQSEYERLFNTILRNGTLNNEEQNNEREIDEHLRAAMDAIVHLPNINIELVGKWIWVSGTTFPVKDALKTAGFTFIKKAGEPFWVFKGVESKSRGDLSLEEIRAKYGSKTYTTKGQKSISGSIAFDKDKFLFNILTLKKLIQKRS